MPKLFIFIVLSVFSWLYFFKTPNNVKGPMDTKLIDIKEIESFCPVWLAPNSSQEVVTIGIVFKGGGDIISPNKPSVPGLLASMMYEGTSDLDHIAFKRLLISKKINLYAYATKDDFFLIIKTLKININTAFSILKAVMFDLRLDPCDFERVKAQSYASFSQMQHYPNNIALEDFSKTAFGKDHPYSKTAKDSAKSVIDSSSEDLRNIASKIFVKKRMYIAASGGINDIELKDYIEKYLSDLPDGEKTDHLKKIPNNLGKTEFFKQNFPQKIMYFYQKGISRKDQDIFSLNLIVESLGGDSESRLMRAIRDSKGLVYYCYTYLSNQLEFDLLVGSCASQNPEDVIKLIKTEWEKLFEFGITQEELDFHVNKITGSYPLRFTSSKGIVMSLLTLITDGKKPKDVEERNNKYRSLTIDQVNDCIKKYIRPNDLAFTVCGM